ncbi:hypothetical protein LEP1GSC008_1735 [Leptospira kirschneri serovar Bulgarica str. Nikolaevo]|uniref:Uncharacterized protein n=1 Tax=Leptospira kirschneri serovar Bulgarica str. Nikolaevo TaxID=1240687 RepID=M6F4R0_9LEPT|nr:hypothetical protein LEP1GSC008_1735 [Leptospira kirschneri serovar Bulgarica str. Nikolaevo]
MGTLTKLESHSPNVGTLTKLESHSPNVGTLTKIESQFYFRCVLKSYE